MATFLVFIVITFIVIVGGAYLFAVIVGLMVMAAGLIYGLLVLTGAGIVLYSVFYILCCVFG